MWAATFSNGGVDEKDVIIMTQMRQINGFGGVIEGSSGVGSGVGRLSTSFLGG
ncbi:hypothetical protein DEO72_LG9g614 [Vigna unguiculata]|uniref:Uncharacterized protein n=1 Tax=Vigna unguiculata TaxID=3917 RepID=A0A4D6MVT7_VIGUN|nr:hypothetical protein DEO72_LG9g614 [Vigna unguiculata]